MNWSEQRVLVTGHTGFKGRWLVRWLTLLGAEVFGYSLGEHFEMEGSLPHNLDNEHHFTGDIRDRDKLLNIFSLIQPTIVVHLAAQSLVMQGYENPVETFEVNVMGTLHMALVAESFPSTRTVLLATTDKCYSNLELGIPFKETDPLGGNDPYSASKACAEVAIQGLLTSGVLSKSFTVRAGNVIGGGDWNKNRIIPDCIRAALADEKLELRNPNAQRPWQHVLDVLYGYLLAIEKQLSSDQTYFRTINFGPANLDHWTVNEVVAELSKHIAILHAERSTENYRMEAKILMLDSGLANRLLKWSPLLSTRESVHATANWYQQVCFENLDPTTISDYQIADYLRRASEGGVPNGFCLQQLP